MKIVKPDTREKEVFEVAAIVRVVEFGGKLPQKYNTKIEMRRTNLSVGRVQRVAITCPFPEKSVIFLLDEPTSALDQETKTKCITALNDIA